MSRKITGEVDAVNKNPMNALSIEEVFEHETFKRIRTLTAVSYTHLDVYKRQFFILHC